MCVLTERVSLFGGYFIGGSTSVVVVCLFVYSVSTLTNWETSELLVLAKHHVTFGKDKVIGMALVSCSTLNDQANLTLTLRGSSVVTDMGQAILNVLSARTFDEFAKEFVILKTSQRSAMGEREEVCDESGSSPNSGARKISGSRRISGAGSTYTGERKGSLRPFK